MKTLYTTNRPLPRALPWIAAAYLAVVMALTTSILLQI
jgi:hypothetical protein